jgi:hypothetical protein
MRTLSKRVVGMYLYMGTDYFLKLMMVTDNCLYLEMSAPVYSTKS